MDNKQPKVIRLRLSKILKERGITQKKLSEMTGISHPGVNNLVRDTTGIKLTTIQTLCTALDIEPADLFEYVSIQKTE